jgi:hypothetical protein
MTKALETNDDVVRIDWREAERLLGEPVDHRWAYWRRGTEVLVNRLHGDDVDDLLERWLLVPYRPLSPTVERVMRQFESALMRRRFYGPRGVQ